MNTLLLTLVVAAVLIGTIVATVMYAHRKAVAQEKATAVRLQAMLRATTRAAELAGKTATAQAASGPGAKQPEAPPPATTRDERECPFCAEPILRKARVCKHCSREVDPLI